jgi:hypothetical protein
MPVFALLCAVRLGNSGTSQLIALTIDGRVMVFEKRGAVEMKAGSMKKLQGKLETMTATN